MITTLYAKLIGAGLLLALVLSGLAYVHHAGYVAGKAIGDKEVSQLKAQQAQTLQKLAELTTKASEAARAAEHTQAQAFAALDQKHLQDLANAQAKDDRVVADLRSRALRMRHEWQCPSNTAPGLPTVAAATGSADENARLREQDAGDLVRLSAEADAQISGLQQALLIERQHAQPAASTP